MLKFFSISFYFCQINKDLSHFMLNNTIDKQKIKYNFIKTNFGNMLFHISLIKCNISCFIYFLLKNIYDINIYNYNTCENFQNIYL